MIKKKSWIFSTFFIFALAMICFIVTYFILSLTESNISDTYGTISRLDGWKGENGLPANLAFMSDKSEIHLVAEDSMEGKSIVFQTYFSSAKVYINNKLVSESYTTDVFKDSYMPYCTDIVDISNAKIGDTITIKMNGIDKLICISGISVGTKRAVDISVYLRSLPSFALFIVLIFAAGIFFFLYRTLRITNRNTNALYYTAWFAALSGITVLLTNDIFIQFVSDPGMCALSLLGLIISVPVPLLLGVEEKRRYGAKKAILRIFVLSDIVFAALLTVLALFKAVSLSYLTIIAFFIAVINVVMLVVLLLLPSTVQKKKDNLMTLISAGVILLGVILDTVISSIGYGTFFACGALTVSFIAVFTNINKVTKMLEIAERAEAIGKLAYTDGLTGMGNTTAFKEKLSRLELTKENYDSIGIIQFDVNNLKTVNDTLGHNIGDDMISNGSRIINEAFGKVGSVYRIGGDEFVAVVAAEHAPMLCDEASQRFEDLIDEFNQTQKKKYKLQIAYGIAFYENDPSGRKILLKDIQKIADTRMYTKKKQMKEKNGEKVRTTTSDSL